MKLKTTTKDACDASDACQEALIRGGFEDTTYSLRALQLGGDKPSEVVYEAWFPWDEYHRDYFVAIYKRTVAASKTSSLVDWDWTNVITLILV